MDLPQVIIHCDWSIQPGKRWQAVASLQAGHYVVKSPTLVSLIPTNLFDQPRPYLLGLDVPLGIPLAYARKIGVERFVDFLDALDRPMWGSFFEPAATPQDISLRRPFYPARPGGTRQAHLVEGLGVNSMADLRRRCDRKTAARTAAAPLFWTLGAQQVGKAALAAWRELLLPGRSNPEVDVAFWPFEGDLGPLLQRHHGVIVEAYPVESLVQLGIKPGRWSKRRQSDRQRVGEDLLAWAAAHDVWFTPSLVALIENGFGPRPEGEDPFDAVAGTLGMINVVLGHQPAAEPADPQIRAIEGWILGQPH